MVKTRPFHGFNTSSILVGVTIVSYCDAKSVIHGNRVGPKHTGLLEAFGIEYPGVAQLVGRLVWDQDAASSSLATRTIFHSIFIHRYITCRRHPSRIKFNNVDRENIFSIMGGKILLKSPKTNKLASLYRM